LRPEAEPPYPIAALETAPLTQPDGRVLGNMPTAGAIAAENSWNDDVLAWGRRGWAQVRRICNWSRTMGAVLPFTCTAEPLGAGPPGH